MKNLKVIRKKRGYTQAQLAQFLHVGNSTVCRWELGTTQPDLYQILKICHVLDCMPSQLYDDIPYGMMPVFDIYGNIVSTCNISEELRLYECCFGLSMPHDISARINCGDTGFFSFGNTAEHNCVVIAYDKNCNGCIDFCQNISNDMQIFAVCRSVYIKI